MDTKTKISQGIADYKSLYPQEYADFKVQMAQTRSLQNNEWGAFDDKEFGRALLEMPENCDLLVKAKLENDEDEKWYASTEGKRWIGRNYPEFLISKAV